MDLLRRAMRIDNDRPACAKPRQLKHNHNFVRRWRDGTSNRRSRRLAHDLDDPSERTDRLSDASSLRSDPSLESCLKSCIANDRRGPCSDRNGRDIRVRFDAVAVREYSPALGQSCTSCGPPIGLGWEYVARPPLHIDAYEAARDATRRRSRLELRLDPGARVETLILAGYGPGEIREATLEANEERKRRDESYRRAVGGRLEVAVLRLNGCRNWLRT
ncbi:hypothetical protein ACHAWF_007140 [Thalassiosira exigua]